MTERPVGCWDCEAYGPEVAGAICFFAEPHERVCSSQEECSARMAAQRQRIFRRISELSAAGNPTFAYLEGKFSTPIRCSAVRRKTSE